MVTPPLVTDIYTINGNNLYLYAVNGNNLSFFSQTKIESVIPSTGTLTRAVGSGDTSITYTSRTADRYIDLTGVTVRFIILKRIVDDPAPADIVFGPASATTNGKTAFYQFTCLIFF